MRTSSRQEGQRGRQPRVLRERVRLGVGRAWQAWWPDWSQGLQGSQASRREKALLLRARRRRLTRAPLRRRRSLPQDPRGLSQASTPPPKVTPAVALNRTRVTALTLENACRRQ